MTRPFKLAALATETALGLSPAAMAKNSVVWDAGIKTCGAWTEAKLTDKERAETFQAWVHASLTGAKISTASAGRRSRPRR